MALPDHEVAAATRTLIRAGTYPAAIEELTAYRRERDEREGRRDVFLDGTDQEVADFLRGRDGTGIGERERSDLGNSLRLIDDHGADLRYVAGTGWHHWTGDRWATDDTGEATRRMARVTRAMLDEVNLIEDEERREKAAKWALNSQGARRIAAALELASADHRAVIRADDLDADPHLLAVANGTVELRTGLLRPSDRADLITLASPIEYRPYFECPRWERFLAEVFDGNDDLIAWLQRLVGYCLTGDTREHVLPVLHGDGANGKSTLVGVLERILGPLALTAAFETFLDGRGGTADYDLARLRGARLVVASESAQGRRLDERMVKQVTGSDTITARHPYGRPFSYRPAFKVILVTNHRPTVDGTDEAIWRRLRLIPFERSFRGREDRTLAADLERETPGILAWAVRGALAWHTHGLGQDAAPARSSGARTPSWRSGGAPWARCSRASRSPRRSSYGRPTRVQAWSPRARATRTSPAQSGAMGSRSAFA